MKIKWFKWIKILFTKKGLMKTKKLQYLFNQMFKSSSSKEIKKWLKEQKL